MDDAYAWYEAQRSGLGAAFMAAVDAALTLAAESPRAFPVLHRETRRVLLRRFPYGIFYRLHDDRVVIVVACAHAKRHPRAWRAGG